MDNRAVVNTRLSGTDQLDFFPTPPWATRALIRHVIRPGGDVLDPCAGAGHMAETLREQFDKVYSCDIADYGYKLDRNGDFLDPEFKPRVDWVIANPPFKLAESFILKSLQCARIGVAMMVRTSFVEGSGRYKRLYSINPPSIIAHFVERVPMVKGRYDPDATTMTSYCWFVWQRGALLGTKTIWIPPCRNELLRDYDVIDPESRRN